MNQDHKIDAAQKEEPTGFWAWCKNCNKEVFFASTKKGHSCSECGDDKFIG